MPFQTRYSLNPGKLPGCFSYERPGYEATTVLVVNEEVQSKYFSCTCLTSSGELTLSLIVCVCVCVLCVCGVGVLCVCVCVCACVCMCVF